MLRNLTIAFAAVVLAASTAQAASPIIERAEDSAWARRILMRPTPADRFAAKPLQPERVADRADALLRAYSVQLFGKDETTHPVLRRERERSSLSGFQVFHRQTVDGIPVEGVELIVSMDRGGRLLGIFSGAKPDLRIEDPQPRVSVEAAVETALAPLGEDIVMRGDARFELVVLPENGGRLSYRVEATLYRPFMDLRAYVDATSGELIRSDDIAIHEKPVIEGYGIDAPPAPPAALPIRKGISTGSGFVFPANPLNGHPERYGLRDGEPTMDDFRESHAIERLDGSGLLRGAYADVENQDQPRANEPSLVYEYSSLVNDGPFQEVNAYWHVDTFQNYLKSTLGIDGAKDVVQELLVHGQEGDQSTYFSGDGHIDLGDGFVDDSEDGEIVIHEYGHAIHDYISGIGHGNAQNTALSEGFGDYLGATFGDNPCPGEWDATAYNPGPPPCLRRADTNKVFPEDWVNQVHSDGEIISGAWWDLREAVGAATADQLIVESFFLFPGSGGFVDFADATLQVDAAINGGVNQDAITTAYTDHGIDPSLSATVSIDHDELGDTENDGPYEILATVGGALPLRAVDPVVLHYRVVGEQDFTPLIMSEVATSEYRAEIPDPGAEAASFEYYIEAHAAAGDVFLDPASGYHSFSLVILSLKQNVPNPFNPETSISFSLARAGRTTLRIYDVAGRLVRTLIDENLSLGAAEPVIWKGDDEAGRSVSSGVYIYVLEQGSDNLVRKMVLLR